MTLQFYGAKKTAQHANPIARHLVRVFSEWAIADERAIGMRRVFAIQIKGFHALPSAPELNRRISKEPSLGHIDKIEAPLLVCAVSFVNLQAVYCWLLEPIVEKGRSGLLEPAKHDWRPLDEDAAQEIVAKVTVFYDALFDLAAKRRRS